MGNIVYLAERSGARHGVERGQGPAQSAQRILLAYSGTSGREYLAVFLASRGYHVTTCGNGKEALRHLASGQFALVVTGIEMPHMDGLELVRALRRVGPLVIAVTDGTGRMDNIYLRSAILSGAVAAHTFREAGTALLRSVDWILRGRDDVIKDVVW